MRQLLLRDLHRAARFCERARAADRDIEPFGEPLAALAESPRALLDLWQVAVDDHGRIRGVVFAALRDPLRRGAPRRADIYGAVDPAFRRRGIGRSLCEPALRWAAENRATLRSRVPDASATGPAFLGALGFRQTSAQLLLTWSRQRVRDSENGSIRVKRLGPGEAFQQFERVAREAWVDDPDAFNVTSEELAQLCREQGRLILLAEAGGIAVGYLSGLWSGDSLAIEEVAVLTERRREGIGGALMVAALRDVATAVLSVAESNVAGRALYRACGFTQSGRRLVYELRHG